MDTVWPTVDRLIHDLGEVRSVVDEAEALPETASGSPVTDLRGAMDQATDAITRIFTDSQKDVVEAAWVAMARAQDAARAARAHIQAARAAREAMGSVVFVARAQAARAQQQQEQIAAKARLRERRRSSVPRTLSPPLGPDEDGGSGNPG